jgi:4'-phosphopantetheinyl transferase EntD
LPLLEALFGPGVVTREGAFPAEAPFLFDEEHANIARAVPVRQVEFAAGRALARSALAELGIGPQPLVNDAAGAPQWPPNVVGSITHTRRTPGGFVAAVAAPMRVAMALGVDAEFEDSLREDLWPLTLRDDERAALGKLAPSARRRVASLIYSAKESYYKCQYTLTRQMLDFSAASVQVDADRGTFALVVRQHAGTRFREGDVLRGRYASRDGLIVTSLEVVS